MNAIIEKLLDSPIVKRWYTARYEARRDRTVHPAGTFDKHGRWYFAESENHGESFSGIRGPTSTWPYSYMLRARTRQHCRLLAAAWLAGEAEIPPDFARSTPDRFALFATLLLPAIARTDTGVGLLATCVESVAVVTPWLVLADYLDDQPAPKCRKSAAFIRSAVGVVQS